MENVECCPEVHETKSEGQFAIITFDAFLHLVGEIEKFLVIRESFKENLLINGYEFDVIEEIFHCFVHCQQLADK